MAALVAQKCVGNGRQSTPGSDARKLFVVLMLITCFGSVAATTDFIEVTTLAGTGNNGNVDGDALTEVRMNFPMGIARLSYGSIVFADYGNNRIRLLGQNGVVSAFAGATDATGGFLDGPTTSSKFNTPMGLCVDRNDVIHVADAGNNRIRRIKFNEVTTVAGSGTADFLDGAATAAHFNTPADVVLYPDDALLVADQNNYRVRKVDGGVVSTFAGTSTSSTTDGAVATATFTAVSGLAVSPTGDGAVYVCDYSSVRKVHNGQVTTVAGSTSGGNVDGDALSTAQFSYLHAIVASSEANTLYVADIGNSVIRKVVVGGQVTTVTAPSAGNFKDGLVPSLGQVGQVFFMQLEPTGELLIADGSNERVRTLVPARKCPDGWTLNAHDDKCYISFSKAARTSATFVKTFAAPPRNHRDAEMFCQHHHAHLVTLLSANHTDWLATLVGPSDRVWIDTREDVVASRLEPQRVWRTTTGRPTTFFHWDTDVKQPGGASCAALRTRSDGLTPGGHGAVLTVDCAVKLSFVCVKRRVPFQITAANSRAPLLPPHPIERKNLQMTHLHGGRRVVLEARFTRPLMLELYGPHLSKHTWITLQTTTTNSPGLPPRQPLPCGLVEDLTGVATPLHVNVTTDRIANREHCGTAMCDYGYVEIPADWPWELGNAYRVCVAVGDPYPHPQDPREFRNELFGDAGDASVVVTQLMPEHLREVCHRREELIETFYGDGWDDSDRAWLDPQPFNHPVQHL